MYFIIYFLYFKKFIFIIIIIIYKFKKINYFYSLIKNYNKIYKLQKKLTISFMNFLS